MTYLTPRAAFFRKKLNGWAVGLLVVTVVTGGGAGTYIVKHHASEQRTEATVTRHNEFFNELARISSDPSAPVRTEKLGAAGSLATDLQPFLREVESEDVSTAPKNALLPTGISEVFVAPGAYKGVNEALGIPVFAGVLTGGSSAVCTECGHFSASFLAKFGAVRSGEVSSVLKAPEPAPENPHAFGIPLTSDRVVLLLLGTWLLLGTLAYTAARMEFRSQYQYSPEGSKPNLSLSPLTVWISLFVIVPHVALLTTLKVLVVKFKEPLSRRSERRSLEKARLAELAELAEHPCATELMRARADLARLQTLPRTELVSEVMEEQGRLIAALEATPDELSAATADLIAAQIRRDHADLSDRPKALKSGVREAGRIGRL